MYVGIPGRNGVDEIVSALLGSEYEIVAVRTLALVVFQLSYLSILIFIAYLMITLRACATDNNDSVGIGSGELDIVLNVALGRCKVSNLLTVDPKSLSGLGSIVTTVDLIDRADLYHSTATVITGVCLGSVIVIIVVCIPVSAGVLTAVTLVVNEYVMRATAVVPEVNGNLRLIVVIVQGVFISGTALSTNANDGISVLTALTEHSYGFLVIMLCVVVIRRVTEYYVTVYYIAISIGNYYLTVLILFTAGNSNCTSSSAVVTRFNSVTLIVRAIVAPATPGVNVRNSYLIANGTTKKIAVTATAHAVAIKIDVLAAPAMIVALVGGAVATFGTGGVYDIAVFTAVAEELSGRLEAVIFLNVVLGVINENLTLDGDYRAVSLLVSTSAKAFFPLKNGIAVITLGTGNLHYVVDNAVFLIAADAGIGYVAILKIAVCIEPQATDVTLLTVEVGSAGRIEFIILSVMSPILILFEVITVLTGNGYDITFLTGFTHKLVVFYELVTFSVFLDGCVKDYLIIYAYGNVGAIFFM